MERTDKEILLKRETVQIRHKRIANALVDLGIDDEKSKGKLFEAILAYGENGGEVLPGFDQSKEPMVYAAWIFIKQDLDADSKAYIKKSRQNSKNRYGNTLNDRNDRNDRNGGDGAATTGNGYGNGSGYGYGINPRVGEDL